MLPGQGGRLLQPGNVEGLAGAHQAHHLVLRLRQGEDGHEAVRREHEFRVDLVHTELHAVPPGELQQAGQLRLRPAAAHGIVRAAHQQYAHAGAEGRLQLLKIDLVSVVPAPDQRHAHSRPPVQLDRRGKGAVDRGQDRHALSRRGEAAHEELEARHHAGQHQRIRRLQAEPVPLFQKGERRPGVRFSAHGIAIAGMRRPAGQRLADGRRAAEIHIRHPQRHRILIHHRTVVPLLAVRAPAVQPGVEKSLVKSHVFTFHTSGSSIPFSARSFRPTKRASPGTFWRFRRPAACG